MTTRILTEILFGYVCKQISAVCPLFLVMLLCQAIRSEKEIWNNSIDGTKKGPGKLYYSKPRLVYMQCSYAMLHVMNAERQHTTAAVQTYNIATGTVCTDSA